MASWDKNVYLYDIQAGEDDQGEIIRKFEHRAPVLDVCFGKDDGEAFSAAGDWRVMRYTIDSFFLAPGQRSTSWWCLFGDDAQLLMVLHVGSI